MQRTISEILLPLAAGLVLGLLTQGLSPVPSLAPPEPSTTTTLEVTVPVQLVLEAAVPRGQQANTEFRGSART